MHDRCKFRVVRIRTEKTLGVLLTLAHMLLSSINKLLAMSEASLQERVLSESVVD